MTNPYISSEAKLITSKVFASLLGDNYSEGDYWIISYIIQGGMDAYLKSQGSWIAWMVPTAFVIGAASMWMIVKG